MTFRSCFGEFVRDLQSYKRFRLSIARFTPRYLRLYIVVNPTENRQFWGTRHVLDDETPNFLRAFSNLTHFRTCGDV